MQNYILALDAGTTSSRAILFDREQNILAVAQRETPQIYPKSGWVEQDPIGLFAALTGVINEVMSKSGIGAGEIAAVGLTNQRETTILWDKNTGQPIYHAIAWQCRRTAPLCQALIKNGHEAYIRENTGLVVDAYFSGTKIRWILDNVPGAREKAENGEILFGTVDTWLIWKLTGGKVFVTDYTNASRTMLFNIKTLCWDKHLLEILDIPAAILPRVASSSEVYGQVAMGGAAGVPIAGIAGDQQAALFGQTCFATGEAKNTYGTGCFLLMNTGESPFASKGGLITTIAASPKGRVQYALEGSVFVGGAVIQWLRDDMRFFGESQDAEYFATKVKDTGGVYLVPAFTGLGAPHWDMNARGSIMGLTRGTKREHIIRAAQEAIAYQVYDLVKTMEKDIGLPLKRLNVDGGASQNNFLMAFQADLLNCQLRRPIIRETTALGVAYLAGLAVGFWRDQDELRALWRLDSFFQPEMENATRKKLLAGWRKAVDRSKNWAEPEPENALVE